MIHGRLPWPLVFPGLAVVAAVRLVVHTWAIVRTLDVDPRPEG